MPELYVGLMSGTSLDGVDAVLADLSAAPRIISTRHTPFEPDLRQTLLALNDAGSEELHRAATAANALSSTYARVVEAVLQDSQLEPRDIAAVGCHGQTVRHNPARGYTVQLVNGALLAELCDIAVVCDFRGRDIAAGGQGAPLVPAFHNAVFRSAARSRVILNIGGMANITCLGSGGEILGFDCGPGNVLLDAWINETLGKPYDDRGGWAAGGHGLPELRERLLAHPYFALPPPKSTGRETFNLDWLRGALRGTEAAVDVQATLVEVTARAVTNALVTHCPSIDEIYVCGGGARNAALLSQLEGLLPGKTVRVTDALGVDAEWVEALAFAWLAQRALKGEPGNVPRVTGAAGLRVLGAIYPR